MNLCLSSTRKNNHLPDHLLQHFIAYGEIQASLIHIKNLVTFEKGLFIGMKYTCYIIFSKTVDRYYIGYTSDIEERLKLHNNGKFGGKSYTHKASDWQIFLVISCATIEEAIFFESRIKRMKSRKYIEDLNKYPDILEKIRNEFKN